MDPFVWKAYWKHYGWRYILVIAVLYWGYTDSGWAGVFYSFLIIGFIAFVVYTIIDFFNAIFRRINGN